ncbi:MAG: TolC family protein, partial [Akkermansiaceae bacterium]|nr:TolC family protein [Akkermansiaceae bacterium]
MKALAAAISCFSLAACGYWSIDQPTVENPVTPPQGWQAASQGNGGKISSGWIKQFGDPRLAELIADAIANNHDLAAASARMREAHYNAVGERARLLPTLDASARGGVTDSLTAPTAEDYRLSLNVSWELDLWGRLRKLSRAGANNAFAATEDYRDARLSLAANTGRAYFNLISANQQVELAKEILESFQSNLRIIERNYKGTGEGALDIQFGRNNVASAQRTLEARELNREEAARTLELLLGRYPAGTLQADAELPKLSVTVPAGLPLQLLERRPDLRAAKARLLASANRADAARLNLLPDLSITASGGNSSSNFERLLDLDRLV